MPRIRPAIRSGETPLEFVKFFTDADELDGFAGNGFDSQGCTAAGIAVQFGQDNAVQFQPFIEGLGRIDSILAGHGIANQINLMRTDGLGDVFDLLHHFFINMKTAGRIKHRNIAGTVLAGILDTLAGNLDGIRRCRVRYKQAPRFGFRAFRAWSIAAGR